ncbi:hypothetical protein FEM33_16075 [Dyadobacter flavalbus]|uniref:Uncharacterized protein n=1 Tax=Dyadobacter flavalbus TaxID=2579942 RepID=A0A5M8QUU6_9BACT|nr:hypothetical protein [Dyadobacter flavalbus]KAA6438223.1 hypothetical protein FEM33_16075 [Dyadobacter flavalbus]
MIEIKVYSKIKDLTNGYEFVANACDEVKPGAFFRHEGYDYLITSEPVTIENQTDGTDFAEITFKAVRLG